MPKRHKRRRKLVEIRPDEVSLVDSPANLRPFFVIKSDKGTYMDTELTKLIALFSGTDEATEKIRKALSENTATALKGALTTLSQYKEDFPPSVNEAIATLATVAAGEEISGGTGEIGSDEGEEGKVEKMSIDIFVDKVVEALSKKLESSFEGFAGSIEKLTTLLNTEKAEKEGEETVSEDEKNKPIYTQEQLDAKVTEAVKEAVDEANAESAKAIDEATEAAIEATLAAVENKQ